MTKLLLILSLALVAAAAVTATIPHAGNLALTLLVVAALVGWGAVCEHLDR